MATWRPTRRPWSRVASASLLVSVSAIFSTSSSLGTGTAGAAVTEPPPLQVLSPGTVGFLVEPLPVHVVFVGYEAGTGANEIDVDRFLEHQTDLSLGVSMIPLFFGRIEPTYTAIQPHFTVTFADDAFEDRFFEHLMEIGTPAPPTTWQQLYNLDDHASLSIDDTLEIDATSVEQWLADNVGSLDIDPREPTIFFLNWFGRDDFQFHVYTNVGDPDTDTGVDFGELDFFKMIAWGGSPAEPGEPARRVWFHDLSAGPEFITANWNLTDAEVSEHWHFGFPDDGITDYRMPPVWEYGNPGGYRPFDDLSGDLGLILRHVGMNMLIAPSPVYPPRLALPVLPSSISIDITRVVDGDRPPSAFDADVIAHIEQRATELQPWNTFTVSERVRSFEGRLADVHRCWLTFETDPTGQGSSCFGNRGDGFAFFDLWLYLSDHWMQFSDRTSDHSIPTLLFDLPDEEAATTFIGVADRDHRDGSQSHNVVYDTPGMRDFGRGPTDVLVHEVGHHLGLSHPTDGLDIDDGFINIAQPFNELFFLWVGGQSASVMSTLANVPASFGQFDRDSMGRWMTAAYILHSNMVLERILDHPRAGSVHDAILAADAQALGAFVATSARDYQTAAALARRGYDLLVVAAAELRIPLEPQARPAAMNARSPGPLFVDPIPPFGSQPVPALAPSPDDVPTEVPEHAELLEHTRRTDLTGPTWVPSGD